MKVLGTCMIVVTLLAVGAASAAAQPDVSLNTRVSIDHNNTPARDVLRSLANAASMQLEMSDEEMAPVTITLTNARVRTALDAVCENAGCKWWVVDGKPPVLKVSRTGKATKLELKGDISVHLKSALFEQAFRSLASYLDVAVVIEGKLPVKSVTISLKEGTTSTLLDALCKAASCTWRFEPESKRLVISAK
jgi:hypothetical protein